MCCEPYRALSLSPPLLIFHPIASIFSSRFMPIYTLHTISYTPCTGLTNPFVPSQTPTWGLAEVLGNSGHVQTSISLPVRSAFLLSTARSRFSKASSCPAEALQRELKLVRNVVAYFFGDADDARRSVLLS